MQTSLRIAAVSVTACLMAVQLVAAPQLLMRSVVEPDWPSWRGPNHNGISPEKDWNPAALADGPKKLWQANVGKGYSAVAVKGENLYTMGNSEDQDTVYCFNAVTGAEIWRYSYPCKSGDFPGPRATPCVDGNSVYTISREGLVLCLDAAKGAVVWQKDVVSELGAKLPTWGISGSPVVHGDMLLLNVGESGAALDKKTGDKIWASAPETCGYASPVVIPSPISQTVLFFGARALHVADLKTGEKLQSYKWITSYDVNAPDPLPVGNNRVFITSGYGKGNAMLDIGKATPSVVWEHKKLSSHFGSLILIDGYIYGSDGNAGRGSLVCLKASDGSEQWRQNTGLCSITAAGGRLIVLSESGDLSIVEVNPSEYKEISSAKGLLQKTCWTAPVLCRGLIYCRRDNGDLVCIDVRK